MRGGYRHCGRERGLTLVEVLVTLIVASIFFALAVPLFVVAQMQSSGDRARVIAANVAQAELESARSMKYMDLTAGQPDPYSRTVGGRAYWVKRTIKNFPAGASDTDAAYKLVTVDVYWTPPPEPVKHVVFKTAIYSQYKGPEVTSLMVTNAADVTIVPKEDGPQLGLIQLTDFPLNISADANPMDWDRIAYVRFTITAKTGGFAAYKDVTKAEAVNPTFTWSDWDDENAGDGDYVFSAVAVSATGKMGDPRALTFTIQGRPATLTLAADDVRPGNGLVILTWFPPSPTVSDLDHYELDIVDPDGRREPTPLDKRSTTYIDRPVGGLPPGDYRYTVVAVDAQGNRISSQQQSATVTTNAAVAGPAQPTGFAVSLLDTYVGIVTQNATLTWNANIDGTTEYWLCREDIGVDSPIAVLDVQDITFLDPQIGWDQDRTWFLTAVDANLNESNPASTSVTVPPPPPAEKFGLTIKVSGYDAFVTVASLENGDVYDLNGDRIVPDTSFNSIFVRSNQKQGVTFRNLPYSTYHVTVAAVDSNRVPITGRSQEFDVELVRNEIVSIVL